MSSGLRYLLLSAALLLITGCGGETDNTTPLPVSNTGTPISQTENNQTLALPGDTATSSSAEANSTTQNRPLGKSNPFAVIAGFNDRKRSYLEQIISIFEHGEPHFRYEYAAFLTGDPDDNEDRGDFEERGATVGRIFVTYTTPEAFQSSDALAVIDKLDHTSALYRLSHNIDSRHFMPSSREREQMVSRAHADGEWEASAKSGRSYLDDLMLTWSAMKNDPSFAKAQDEVFYEETHKPALKKIANTFHDYKISPFTYLCIVDAYVLRGIESEDEEDLHIYGGDELIDQTFSAYGSRNITSRKEEMRWLKLFFKLRTDNGTKSDLTARKYRIALLKAIQNAESRFIDLEGLETYAIDGQYIDPEYHLHY